MRLISPDLKVGVIRRILDKGTGPGTMSAHTLRLFGFTGAAFILLGIVIASLRFQGRQAERYSFLNHFISELGEVGVSRSAWVFNLGLILGGLITLPYLIGLGMAFRSLLAWLGVAAGVIAVLGVGAVGVFPLNNLTAHTTAANTYFRSGLVMIFFFGLAILFQPEGKILVPKTINLLSLAALIVYATFLVLLTRVKPVDQPVDVLDPLKTPDRPRVWPLAVMEWAVFFVSILWLIGVALYL